MCFLETRKTGRNFAAGMSGGIAYLYSNDGKFDEKKFNLEMVEIENLQVKDIEIVKELIQNHVIHTKSPKGNDILENWKKLSKNFIKVSTFICNFPWLP